MLNLLQHVETQYNDVMWAYTCLRSIRFCYESSIPPTRDMSHTALLFHPPCKSSVSAAAPWSRFLSQLKERRFWCGPCLNKTIEPNGQKFWWYLILWLFYSLFGHSCWTWPVALEASGTWFEAVLEKKEFESEVIPMISWFMIAPFARYRMEKVEFYHVLPTGH